MRQPKFLLAPTVAEADHWARRLCGIGNDAKYLRSSHQLLGVKDPVVIAVGRTTPETSKKIAELALLGIKVISQEEWEAIPEEVHIKEVLKELR